MNNYRKIDRIIKGMATKDGAGVRLTRYFGSIEPGAFDPFLLLDFFGSENPKDYLAGFPWHPHRGMETVTYMLNGRVEHGDSMGNKGVIGKGDVQWMSAGSGIIHQEMPLSDESAMYGFQLWVNLPAALKMSPPAYQEIKAETIPSLSLCEGVDIKIIAGELNGVRGPVKDIAANPSYIDVTAAENKNFTLDTVIGHTTFAIVFEGSAYFDESKSILIKKGEGVLFTDGEKIQINIGEIGARFLLVSGKPIKEPIAWGGPIVMNTREELEIAFNEYSNGTFIGSVELFGEKYNFNRPKRIEF